MIDVCYNWSVKNGMRFKTSKCKVMTLNIGKSPVPFFLAEEIIDFVREYKYLGVKLSNKRQTSLITHHITSILEKAEDRVNCIRNLGFRRRP